MDKQQTMKYYNQNSVSALVKKFAKSAKQNHLDGVVCSPQEIKYIRREIGKNFIDKDKFNIVLGVGSSGPTTKWGVGNYSNLINVYIKKKALQTVTPNNILTIVNH